MHNFKVYFRSYFLRLITLLRPHLGDTLCRAASVRWRGSAELDLSSALRKVYCRTRHAPTITAIVGSATTPGARPSVSAALVLPQASAAVGAALRATNPGAAASPPGCLPMPAARWHVHAPGHRAAGQGMPGRAEILAYRTAALYVLLRCPVHAHLAHVMV